MNPPAGSVTSGKTVGADKRMPLSVARREFTQFRFRFAVAPCIGC